MRNFEIIDNRWQGNNVNLNATASAQQATVVVTEERRKELQAKLKQIQEQSG